MLRSIITAATAALLVAGLSVPADAAPCRDAKGHFIKCPTPAAAKGARCRDAKGHFAKCETPGAKPAK